jgi:RNA polymerase sigma-70 factor (ECF subfamily)
MNSLAIGNGFNSAGWLVFARQRLFDTIESVSEEIAQNRERDIEMLRRISQGDRSAFAQFYDLYSSLLFSIAIKILNDPKEAEDVLQEVFMQIWEKAGMFDPKLGKPSSWAITLVRNKAIDRIRASQRRSRLAEAAAASGTFDGGDSPVANESIHGREKAALLRSAVAGLPAEQRHAIEMAFFSGLTQNEISDKLREPLGTIKARIRRGMLKLRDKLEGSL